MVVRKALRMDQADASVRSGSLRVFIQAQLNTSKSSTELSPEQTHTGQHTFSLAQVTQQNKGAAMRFWSCV